MARDCRKVVMVTPRPPWSEGGVERMVKEIAMRLTSDFEVAVYSGGDPKCDERQIDMGFEVRTFSEFGDLYHFSPSLLRGLMRTKCDLIHCHNFSSFMPMASCLAKRDRKLVFSPHFHIVARKWVYGVLRRAYDPLVGRYLFSKADRVISFSQTESAFIRERFSVPSEKVSVIHHGTTFHETQGVADNAHPTRILYAGRLEKYKNVHLIIESLRYLPKEYELYIIGSGGYAVHLEKLAQKLGLEDRAKFLGYLSDDEMYRCLQECGIFVQLSEIESGISISCIEALAAGKPVIVNCSLRGLGEMAELFGDDGVFGFDVASQSVIDLADLIARLRGHRAHLNAEDWTWDNSAKRMGALYHTILNGKN